MERWSEQRIWDAILDNVQIVVSTHAVLADALTHGFVKMSNLALLIFDEGTQFGLSLINVFPLQLGLAKNICSVS
jgi:RecG-like helicase